MDRISLNTGQRTFVRIDLALIYDAGSCNETTSHCSGSFRPVLQTYTVPQTGAASQGS